MFVIDKSNFKCSNCFETADISIKFLETPIKIHLCKSCKEFLTEMLNDEEE